NNHSLCNLAGVQKAAKASHFPDLEIFSRGLFQDTAGHVRPDVEHQYFDWTDLAFDLIDEADDLVFLPRIGAKAEGFPSCILDALDQRRQLFRVATRDTRNVALLCKAPCNC